MNKKYDVFTAIGSSIGYLAFSYLGIFITMVFGWMVLLILSCLGYQIDLSNFSTLDEPFFTYASFIGTLFTLIALYFFVKKRKKIFFNEASLHKFDKRFIPIVFLFFLSYIMLLPYSIDLLKTFSFMEPYVNQTRIVATEQSNMVSEFSLLGFLSICLLGPLMEEIFFRGIILNRLKSVMPLSVAIAVQAVMFGIMHSMNFAYFLTSTMIGIALGLITIRFQSILPAIIGHSANNSLAFFSAINPDIKHRINQFPTWLCLCVCFVIVVLTSVLLFKKDKSKLHRNACEAISENRIEI